MLPALLPGLLVLLLAFPAGGFFPGSWAPLALVAGRGAGAADRDRRAAVRRLQPVDGGRGGRARAARRWMLRLGAGRTRPGAPRRVRPAADLPARARRCARRWRRASTGWPGRSAAWRSRSPSSAWPALITRLRPDLSARPGYVAGRLDYPVTYWNGLGHAGRRRRASSRCTCRPPAASRGPCACSPPACPDRGVTVYLTLSRGGIAASVSAWPSTSCSASRARRRARCWRSCRRASRVRARLRRRAARRHDKYADAAGRAQGRDVLSVLRLASAPRSRCAPSRC